MKFFSFPILAVVACGFLVAGCVTPKTTSPLAQARPSVYLKKGLTTQAQVLEKFGTPNIITTDSNDREVWTYQQHAVANYSTTANLDLTWNTNSFNSFFTQTASKLGLGGSSYMESSKTMTLTIKFSRNNVVEEYKSIYTSF